MSFFEAPPPLEQPPELPQPAWLGPPANVLGAAVPLRVVLARTEEVAVAVTDASAYPTGVELTLAVRVRRESHDAAFLHVDPIHGPYPRRGGLPDELLRFGVELADGRKATSVSGFPAWDHEGEPEQPVLIPRGGGGGGRSWDQRFWLWPLPPPGLLALVCEWPAHGVSLTRVEVDAGEIVDAAARAEELWPDDTGARSGGAWRAYP